MLGISYRAIVVGRRRGRGSPVEFRESNISLSGLKQKWRAVIETAGGHCPCCDRWGKIYPRPINSMMARSLIWLCSAPAISGWVDVPNQAPRWLIRSNQLSTLRWWDLVDRAGSEGGNRKYAGFWRPTELGRAFVEGKVAIPRTVYTYNGGREHYGDETIHISDCFSSHFSYQEVMQGVTSERKGLSA